MKYADHYVLRLSPYHPDLNPIENIRIIVVNRNVTYKLLDLIPIAVEAFNIIISEDWRKICRHTVDAEIRMFEWRHC